MAQLIHGTTIAGHAAIHAGNMADHGIATTGYVTTQINNLIDGAPGALDTLNELAAALGDNGSFATGVTDSIAGKVSKAGDIITTSNAYGLVIDHTPVLGDFVDALLLRSTTSGQRAQLGFATVDSDGNHHRASIRAYKGAGTLEGVFGIALRQVGGNHTQRLTLTSAGNLTVDGQINASGGNSGNWNTAFGWGNHASAGYQAASTAITTSNIGSQSVLFATTAGNSATTSQTTFSSLVVNNSSTFSGQSTWFGGYGAGSGPGIALENLSTFARFAFWGLDFYDWNHGIQMTIDNAYVSATNSFRAPIFYDSQDTTYYVDPNSTSNLAASYIGRVLINYDGTDTWFRMQSGNRMRITTTGGTDFIIPNTGEMSYNGNTVIHTGNIGSYALTSLPSHNHDDRYYTESESDGRYLYYRGMNQHLDFQRFVDTPGIVRFDQANATGGFSNAPGGYTYGGVLSMRGVNFGFQLWGSHTGDFFYKTQWENDNYSGWREVITALNIGSQSVSYASTAGTASNVTINYNNNSNANYQLLWGSGNSVYGTGEVYVNPSNDHIYASGFYASSDIYLGTRGVWLSSWLNQSVQTGASPTFANLTSNGYVGNSSSQTRDKLRVWDSSQYTIGMKSGYNYGHLGNDQYAMSFQMNDENGRGFWWGDTAHSDAQGAAALTTDGRMNIAKSLSIGEGETITSPSSTPLYVRGQVDGADVLAVDGVNGRLFTVTDSVLDVIYSVNTIAGLPILEVLANSTVKLGPFSAPVIINASGISTPSHGTSANWLTAYNKRPTGVAFSGSSTKTLTLTLGDGSTLTANFNDIDTDTDTNTDGQTLSISGSTLTISGGNSITIPSGGISQATADGLYQPLENQRLSTGNSPTFVDIYANEWFRNNNANEGLYNQATGTHLYSSNGSGWTVTGSGGIVELVFRSNHQSTIRGYVYADTSNNIGFLANDGNWGLQLDSSKNVKVFGYLTVGNGTSSDIYMTDSDEGTRRIHCNSNRIGFLTQDSSWGAYCDDAGNWFAANFSGSSSGTNTGDQTNISGNSATTSQTVFNDLKINFPSGAGGGHSFGNNHYSMGLDSGNGGWSDPHYRDLIIGYHTGIRLGANYSGIRFYSDSPTTDTNNDGNGDGGERLLMTVGGYVGTASHTDVVVNNNLFANVSMRSPIFYDSNDTAYYLNPAGGSRLRNLYIGDSGSDWSDPGGWGTQLHVSHGPHSIIRVYARTEAIETVLFSHGGGQSKVGSGTNHNFTIVRNFSDRMVFYNGYTFSEGYLQAADSLRAPIFYDSNDTGFYLDPNGTSNLLKFSAFTMAYNAMNPMSVNSPYVDRYNGSVGYRNGTMGNGRVDFNTIFSNWGSGFIDTWSSPDNAPGGSSHYIGLQGMHYSELNTNTVYGFQMVCAGEADNRFFWRASWPSKRAWVEMIHSGTIGSQSVNYAASAGNADTVDGYHASTSTIANGIVVREGNGYILGNYINMSDNSVGSGVTGVIVKQGDNYYRTGTAGAIQSFLGLGSLAYSSATIPTNNNQLSNGAGYITSSGSISGNASTSDHLNSTRDTPSGKLQYWDAPGLDITEAPSGDWHNTIRMGHGSPLSYYSNTLAIRMTGSGVGDIYTQTIMNGVRQGWKRHWNDSNLTNLNQLTNGPGYITSSGSISGTAARATRANGNFYIDDNYGNTVVGVYDSFRMQGVFAMGDAYKLPADGTSSGNLYGISWSHPNHGGEAVNLSDHGMIVQINGRAQTAISSRIWCIGDIIAFSDARVKANVEVIDNPLERLSKVRGVTFTRIDLEDPTKRYTGVIAQEMREALPEAVSENANGELSVSYGNTVGLLIESIKAQQAQIEELKTEVKKLKGE